MKQILSAALAEAITNCRKAGVFQLTDIPEILLTSPTNNKFGDLSTNVAMILASQLKRPPYQIAQNILDRLSINNGLIDKIELAGAGFINFYINKNWWQGVLLKIDEQQHNYGSLDLGAGTKIQVEFVSANPTGPLHIGHGRGAAVGDVLANILAKAGYEVEKEYYINDAGNQMFNLGRSVFARYQQNLKKDAQFPENGYKGEYITDIARLIIEQDGAKLLDMPEDEAVSYCTKTASRQILNGIKHDLERFGIEFDHWFSETGLYKENMVQKAVSTLKKRGYLFEEQGALWLKSSAFGDDKDRVVIRSNGNPTYLASDIAYHQNKYQRFLIG